MARPKRETPQASLALAMRGKPSRTRPGTKKRRGRRAAPIPVAPLTKDGLPNVMAAASVVADLDTGDELFVKHPDAVRPIASVGKLFVALAVREKGIPLEKETAVTEEDRKHALGGARSRLLVGTAYKNIDLLRAMLVASDNRACTALGRAAGMTPAELVAAMNRQAKRLGLKRTRFTDPSGLNGNVSTPRELLVALRAVLEDEVLAEILATPSVFVSSTSHPRYGVQYFNTNVSLRVGRFPVIGGKTGYTDEARYCLATSAKLNGRRVGMVFLGAEGEMTRFADFSRVAQWVVDGGPARTRVPLKDARALPQGVGASANPPPGAMTPKLAR
ncbi:MAG: D-alanyl-D-alanine carboxypeptidase [Deltaproteobacteria bacterium]|nr:D-alanyl-D-alanine carboxypeptidase [Deltaproteobacteria bacterium]